MESGVKSLASRKQLLAAIVAAGLLVGIFVPFQRAEALTVNFPFNGSTFTKPNDATLTVQITLAPGEVLDSSIPVPVTISPGTASPGTSSGTINLAAETFTPNTGTPNPLLQNIQVTPDDSPVPYAYAYAYAITDGWVGPLTITITATLKTSFLTGGNSLTAQTFTLTINSINHVANFNVQGPAVTPGGGFGGGSRSAVVLNQLSQILPPSYFAEFPLDKIKVSNSAFLNAAGLAIAEGKVKQQTRIAGTFTNYQEAPQNYAFIVQVTDADGFATDISWQESIIASGGTTTISVSWTPETGGVYTVKIFVWDGISSTPQPLSSVTVKRISVTE